MKSVPLLDVLQLQWIPWLLRRFPPQHIKQTCTYTYKRNPVHMALADQPKASPSLIPTSLMDRRVRFPIGHVLGLSMHDKPKPQSYPAMELAPESKVTKICRVSASLRNRRQPMAKQRLEQLIFFLQHCLNMAENDKAIY